MNIDALKAAERAFLREFPGGFRHPDLVEVGKKHKMPQHEAFAKERFAKARFQDPKTIVADMATAVGRSSMVSMFEKPRFRDFAKQLDAARTRQLASALHDLLHGPQADGFERLVDVLSEPKLAKWPIVTVVPAYYRPQKEVFVKPTTAKLIIRKLELDLTYQARPSWAFYAAFRKAIMTMRSKVNENLQLNNPAFCGFLMMALED